jgi:hypothetical protein
MFRVDPKGPRLPVTLCLREAYNARPHGGPEVPFLLILDILVDHQPADKLAVDILRQNDLFF